MQPLIPNKYINHPEDIITRLIESRRLPHALLLSGGSLREKREFALLTAQKLLCTVQQQQACGNCQSCRWVKTISHPDLQLLETQENQTAIKIEDVRTAIEQLLQTAHQGKYKIIIFSPAEAMPVGAMNALLKTLEEPPAKSLLILSSQYPSLLPATVRSRCQRLVFPATSPFPQAVESLPLGLDPRGVTSEGSDRLNKLESTLQLLQTQRTTPSQAAAEWLDVPLLELLDNLLSYAFNLIIKTTKKNHSAQSLFFWHDAIQTARRQILLKYNANQTLVLENLFSVWMMAGQNGYKNDIS